MTDISTYLTQAEREIRRASEAIAHGTMNEEQWKSLEQSLSDLQKTVTQAQSWTKANRVYSGNTTSSDKGTATSSDDSGAYKSVWERYTQRWYKPLP